VQHSSLFGCRRGERRSDGIFGLAGPISTASEKNKKNPSINQRWNSTWFEITTLQFIFIALED
jgi:hypothetical protein